MQANSLTVEGAFEFCPQVYADDRGYFVSPHQQPAFIEAVGKPLFPVEQTNISESRRGVVRGVHFTLTPPGGAKYVYCVRGKVLDIVVDLRVGSPTFGRWDGVILDQESFRSVYFPIGVGHAFVALEDDSAMCYLMSGSYVPHFELAISVLDPALGLPIPGGIDPILSQRDRVAPTLAEAQADGILPDYAKCLDIAAETRSDAKYR